LYLISYKCHHYAAYQLKLKNALDKYRHRLAHLLQAIKVRLLLNDVKHDQIVAVVTVVVVEEVVIVVTVVVVEEVVIVVTVVEVVVVVDIPPIHNKNLIAIFGSMLTKLMKLEPVTWTN
jgi:hypothetical protein